MSFTSDQRERVVGLWSRMLAHPFLVETRDGTIRDETFARWMRQDYLFVEHAVHFLAALLARAPKRHRDALGDSINALRQELVLFEEQAQRATVDFTDTPPAFVTHAYMQFLTATAAAASYAEAYTVLYVAEAAYHDSWRVVRDGIASSSKWLPFVDNWTSEPFIDYVTYLQRELDGLAAAAGAAELERMGDLFELTTRYEIAFWEMALSGKTWPGIPEEP